MAHKGYVTNLNEFVNSANQRYQHRRYIQQLQYLLKQHSRNRRCLPDPAIGVHSKQAKRPLPTSPCFQQTQNQTQIVRTGTPTIQQDPTKLNTLTPGRPVSPGRSILSSPRSRSRCSNLSRGAFVGSALSNFNTITCFANSPVPPQKLHKIPTVVITSEGNKALLNTVNRSLNANMAPSSVHNPVNRTSNHVPTTSTTANNVSTANQVAATNSSNLRKVHFKLPPSNNNNHHQNAVVLQQQQQLERTKSAPPLYRSISESSLSLVQSTISDEQNETIRLRNQRILPQKPLDKHPMSPTLPIAKLKLTKELNLKDSKQQTNLTRNTTMYNQLNSYNGQWPQQRSIYDPRYQANQFTNATTNGLSRYYSSSLPNSPSKRPIYNHYNPQLTHQLNQRHLSSMPSYQPLDCYTVGQNGMLSSHGSRFPLGSIPPLNSSTSPHNILHSPQTSSLPTYSQITKPSFLFDGNQYNLHRTGLYNPILFDKTLQRLKRNIPLCKSAPLSSIIANSMPTTSHLNTHDAVTGLPRRRHTTTALAKSNLTPKTNLATGHRSATLLTDGTIEQEESPLAQMRKEIKFFVDERKRQLEQGSLDVNNLTTNNLLNTNTITGNLTGKYGLGSNLSNSAVFNDQSPLSSQLLQHSQFSPSLTSNLAQNRQNYLSSSESDLNALLNLYSHVPDPVLERSPLAGQTNYQRIPQFHLNRTKHRYTVDDLRRHHRNPLDYYDDSYLYGNGLYGNSYYDTLFDRQYQNNYHSNHLPSSTYRSLIDYPTSSTYAYNRYPGYYASTGSIQTALNSLNNNLTGTGLTNYNLSTLNSGLIGANNYRSYDQDLLNNSNYLSNDYHHYSLDHLGLDRTSYSRPASPYYGHSTVPEPAPLDYTQHSLSTNHLDSIDLNNNLLSKPLIGQTTLPLRSYRL